MKTKNSNNLKIFSNPLATLGLMDKMNHNLTCVKMPLPSADVNFYCDFTVIK